MVDCDINLIFNSLFTLKACNYGYFIIQTNYVSAIRHLSFTRNILPHDRVKDVLNSDESNSIIRTEDNVSPTIKGGSSVIKLRYFIKYTVHTMICNEGLTLKSMYPFLSMSNVRNTWSQNSSAFPLGKNILYMSTNFAGVNLPFGQSCCKITK